MNRILYVFMLSLFLGSTAFTQTLDAYMEAADSSFVQKDYYSAVKYYEIALEITDNERTDIWYKYAESARLGLAYEIADQGYQEIISREATSNFPLVLYWAANMKQRIGDYETAKNLYNRFLNESDLGKEGYYKRSAEKERDDSGWAIEMVAEPEDKEIIKLGPNINTPYSEFGAYQSGDTLYYSSLAFVEEKDEHNPPRLYHRMLASVDGAPFRELADFNKTLRHAAHTAFNRTQTRMYYTLCDYVGLTAEIRCKIYYRDKDVNGNWDDPIALPSYINMDGYTATEPNVGYDKVTGQEYLFFASDRPDGEGKMDIWCSYINEDGGVSTPLNVTNVNTAENDITPFFHDRSQTLYFSSDGRRGLGSYDIYKMKKNGDAWEAARHLGYPINTSYNDIYYSISEDDSKAYLSSNRAGSTYLEEENKFCCNDIYEMELQMFIDLLALTFNKISNEPLTGVNIELFEIDENGNRMPVSSLTNIKGNDFIFPLEKGKQYLIVAIKDGFNTITEELSTLEQDISGLEQIEKRLYLEPVELDLTAYTFDLDDNLPLNGATVGLYTLTDGVEKLVDEQTMEEGNKFFFPLELGKDYVIRAKRKGYESHADTLKLSEIEITETQHIEINIFLVRNSFDDYLPLSIYFDNDIPDRRTTRTTTNVEYAETFDPYYGRKSEFKEEFISPMEGEEKFLAENRFESFFDREVQKGYQDLVEFTEKLYNFLQRGNSVEIAFKGYASPRAGAEYNKKLSQRRISSVINHFRNYKGGIFREIMDANQLTIMQEAFGESQSPPGIDDKLFDERNSIYSVGASVERRVEVIEVNVKRKQDSGMTDYKGSLNKKRGR